MTRPLTIIACLLLLVAMSDTLQANTRFGFGTIIAVDAEGSNDRGGKPNYTVLYEFRNLNWSSVWHVKRYGFAGKVRGFGDRVYLLDGKPSTPAEALVVGRAICHAANDGVVFVSTKPGPHPLGQPGSFADGFCRLEPALLINLTRGETATGARAAAGLGIDFSPRWKIGSLSPIHPRPQSTPSPTHRVSLIGNILVAAALSRAYRGISDYHKAPYINMRKS